MLPLRVNKSTQTCFITKYEFREFMSLFRYNYDSTQKTMTFPSINLLTPRPIQNIFMHINKSGKYE